MTTDPRQLPPLSNHEQFERFCRRVWNTKWQLDEFQLVGRTGQEQKGVDFHGLLNGCRIGVQCKQKNSELGSRITAEEIRREIKKAKNFRPRLDKYILATTAQRDASIQEYVRLQSEILKEDFFEVDIFSWQDIWEMLIECDPRQQDNIIAEYWHSEIEQYERCRQALRLQGFNQAIESHHRYLFEVYERLPVLERHPFSLRDIYVPLECEIQTWEQLQDSLRPSRRRSRIETRGQQVSLLDEVLRRIEDPGYRKPIVVQGTAGSGKTAFSLHLARELNEKGYTPIYISLGDRYHGVDVGRDLIRAIVLEKDLDPFSYCNGLLEEVQIHELLTGISRDDFARPNFVLILDGWDEITSTGERGEVGLNTTRFLRYLREEILFPGISQTRVVLLGRPWNTLWREGGGELFRHDETPIFTITPLSPKSVKEMLAKIQAALRRTSESTGHAVADFERWGQRRLDSLGQEYHDAYFSLIRDSPPGGIERYRVSGLEALGTPLLLLLTAQLRSSDLVSAVTPTTLHRVLIDLTCNAGRMPNQPHKRVKRIYPPSELRLFLQQVAAYMESIARSRISESDIEDLLKMQPELESSIDDIRDIKVAGHLMLSYYFWSSDGRFSFLHRSFKDYFVAEYVIERLKRYAEKVAKANSTIFLADSFNLTPDNPLSELCRDLWSLLSRRWMRPEVGQHLDGLLEWEINQRNGGSDTDSKAATSPLSIGGWRQIRDGLALVWERWCQSGYASLLDPRLEGYDLTSPKSGETHCQADPFLLVRLVDSDAYFGDAIFRLNARVHFEVLRAEGWIDDGSNQITSTAAELWEPISRLESAKNSRVDTQVSYQSSNPDMPQIKHFIPAAGGEFSIYSSRINSSSGRPAGKFPLGLDLRGINFEGASISAPQPDMLDEVRTYWAYANLSHATLSGCILKEHDFSVAYAQKAIATCACFDGATLERADLSMAQLRYAIFYRANLSRAVLREAVLSSSILRRALLVHADLRKAKLEKADLTKANLRDATLRGANLKGANLTDADLTGADLRNARLEHADLSGANLSHADLRHAILRHAQIDKRTNLTGSKQEGADFSYTEV